MDVRILAATSKNLVEELEKGRFREDLYDRINVVNIALPPLRARREDIPALAEHFLRLSSVENEVKPKHLAPRALDFLARLPWRGNVRELRNLMERLVVLVARDGVTHRDVMEALQMTGTLVPADLPLPLATGPLAIRAPVHPRAAGRQPGESGHDGARPRHRADQPLPKDEAAGDPAQRGEVHPSS